MHVATQPNVLATTEGNDLSSEEEDIMTSIITSIGYSIMHKFIRNVLIGVGATFDRGR